jgi:hypothetical protein
MPVNNQSSWSRLHKPPQSAGIYLRSPTFAYPNHQSLINLRAFVSKAYQPPCCKTQPSCALFGRRCASNSHQIPGGRPYKTRGLRSTVEHHHATAFGSDDSSSVLEDSWKLLVDFTTKEARGFATPMLSSSETRQALRQALLTVASAPWPPANWTPGRHADANASGVLLGVIASDVRLAVRSLRDYCEALGVPFVAPESRIANVTALPQVTGPVYIKYNSKSGVCYVSRYDGRDRGVLVQFGSMQIGHLPLGLLDEPKAKPPPALE